MPGLQAKQDVVAHLDFRDWLPPYLTRRPQRPGAILNPEPRQDRRSNVIIMRSGGYDERHIDLRRELALEVGRPLFKLLPVTQRVGFPA
jgi:hypothetical protein